MKILAIRLKNLASLAGEQEIDFTREPLSSAGLFAITGPTGAGKSTVLDALCLALFGSTPRLESTSASSKVPDGRNELSSNDERNLRAPAATPKWISSASTATAIAPAGKPGAPGQGGRRLAKSQQSLQDLETQQMLAANKKSEFREQLEQKLGLISPSSLAPCCWPRANSAPSSRPATTTAAHCWRNSPTPACTAN